MRGTRIKRLLNLIRHSEFYFPQLFSQMFFLFFYSNCFLGARIVYPFKNELRTELFFSKTYPSGNVNLEEIPRTHVASPWLSLSKWHLLYLLSFQQGKNKQGKEREEATKQQQSGKNSYTSYGSSLGLMIKIKLWQESQYSLVKGFRKLPLNFQIKKSGYLQSAPLILTCCLPQNKTLFHSVSQAVRF